jgi:hypothetical protein
MQTRQRNSETRVFAALRAFTPEPEWASGGASLNESMKSVCNCATVVTGGHWTAWLTGWRLTSSRAVGGTRGQLGYSGLGVSGSRVSTIGCHSSLDGCGWTLDDWTSDSLVWDSRAQVTEVTLTSSETLSAGGVWAKDRPPAGHRKGVLVQNSPPRAHRAPK